MTEFDPRPFVGEPLALDLLNTLWKEEGRQKDLLDSPAGLRAWLTTHHMADRFRADREALEAARAARTALAAAIGHPGSADAARQVGDILAHGRVRLTLTTQGPGEEAEFARPAWGPAWTAARDYLRLLATAPDRIRVCAQPDCIRYFLDTSRNGTRRWCSMAECGNRAKAARHYSRNRHTCV
ncbi:CGNR zinc finger domain-containing protein [Streptomyces sp. NPDC057638]|uniref:CGNR zinc finger domain-containing protein n=1 Tax=Streptomyces sp. NPDC057638 TaxID=3346190 RepID=UPI0036C0CFEF